MEATKALNLAETMNEIKRLKQALGVTILAHCYQHESIQEVADFVGDSFQLAKAAAKPGSERVIMCGVRFMAETVKLLSPEKHVRLSHVEAGCPMAEQVNPQDVIDYKRNHPDVVVVSYINTTAELKAVSDVCVTSASAISICTKLPQEEILFLPDPNLGQFIAKALPEKRFTFIGSGCPVHSAITESEVLEAKSRHPEALLLCHPECPPQVLKHADYIGATTGILKFAAESSGKSFIIGTEIAIVEHLMNQFLNKSFYLLSKKLICPDMKLTSASELLNCLKSDWAGADERDIVLSESMLSEARKCIDKMLDLG